MLKKIWQKITNAHRNEPDASVRQASQKLGVPKSTVHYHHQRTAKRQENPESAFWDTEAGQNFIKRLMISAIYTFGIKGGVGAGRIEEFMNQIRIGTHAGVSESSIYRMMKEIEASILRYKELIERDLTQQAAAQLEDLEVVLGLDETWLDNMLLVCQELSSGYLFLKLRPKEGTPKVGGTPLSQRLEPLD